MLALRISRMEGPGRQATVNRVTKEADMTEQLKQQQYREMEGSDIKNSKSVGLCLKHGFIYNFTVQDCVQHLTIQ